VEPTTIKLGSLETLTGFMSLDSDITSAHFKAEVTAKGVRVSTCAGDGTSDMVCKLPLGAGTITVKKMYFPLKTGVVQVPVDVKTNAFFPATDVDIHILAEQQNGESALCLDVHAAKAVELAAEEVVARGSLAVTWKDCGAQHATVTNVEPTTIKLGSLETLTGFMSLDSDITSAHFKGEVTAKGIRVSTCSGDGTSDMVCKLPLGAGTITVKKVYFPLRTGVVQVPVDVKTNAFFPATDVDIHITAEQQNGDSALCLDVHAAKMATLV